VDRRATHGPCQDVAADWLAPKYGGLIAGVRLRSFKKMHEATPAQWRANFHADFTKK
jgi:hypothetical protein